VHTNIERHWVSMGLAALALSVSSGLALASAPLALANESQPNPNPTSTSRPATTPNLPAPNLPAPVPATRTTKARNVPDYPTRGRERGKRIVYDKSLMTIWLIDAREQVVAKFPVVGRPDRPAPGVYKVYSKSDASANPIQKLTFKNMVRFAHGQSTGAPIGFHDIPRTYDGRPIHGEDVLGLPLGSGGCVRMSTAASAQVYEFARVGTTVEVLAPAPS
jgi:hypothetical protein